MTPWQLRMCIEATTTSNNKKHDAKAWFMYHAALLSQVKPAKFPPLSDFQAGGKKAAGKKESEESIMAMIMERQKQRDRAKNAGSKS